MGSRRITFGDRDRLPGITRGSLVGATFTASEMLRQTSRRSVEVLTAARVRLTAEEKVERSATAWQDEESRLARYFDWLRLSELQQRRHAAGRRIYTVEAQIAALNKRRWALLKVLKTLPTTGGYDVASKRPVAVWAMGHERVSGFNPHVQCVQELSVQLCRACGAALLPLDLLISE